MAQAEGFPTAVGCPAAVHCECVTVNESALLLVGEERDRLRDVIGRGESGHGITADDVCIGVAAATPDDIAQAIAFLADEKQSGFINGHTLAVDGGWTADGSWESLRLRHR